MLVQICLKDFCMQKLSVVGCESNPLDFQLFVAVFLSLDNIFGGICQQETVGHVLESIGKLTTMIKNTNMILQKQKRLCLDAASEKGQLEFDKIFTFFDINLTFDNIFLLICTEYAL